MKYIHVSALFLMLVFHSSCGQTQTNASKDNTKPGTVPQVKENSAGDSAVRLAATAKVPVSMVRSVRKAANGDILIASYLVVFRYDGTSFTNISSKISQPRFSSFWDVLEDSKGNMWYATRDSGVYLLPAGQTTFQHFTTRDGLGTTHLYEDKAGNIWFGSGFYDGKSFQNFATTDGFPGNNVRLLLEDKTGKLWFGAQAEDMFVYDARPDSIGRKTFTVLKNKDGKAFNNVWSIIEDRKGNIWFGDVDGLWRYEPSATLPTGSGTYTRVSQKGAYAIIEDKKGNIWTTGADGPPGSRQAWSLSRYDVKSLYSKNPTVTEILSTTAPALLGLIEANDGSIWFGGMGSMTGVYRYDGKAITDFRNATGKP